MASQGSEAGRWLQQPKGEVQAVCTPSQKRAQEAVGGEEEGGDEGLAEGVLFFLPLSLLFLLFLLSLSLLFLRSCRWFGVECAPHTEPTVDTSGVISVVMWSCRGCEVAHGQLAAAPAAVLLGHMTPHSKRTRKGVRVKHIYIILCGVININIICAGVGTHLRVTQFSLASSNPF